MWIFVLLEQLGTTFSAYLFIFSNWYAYTTLDCRYSVNSRHTKLVIAPLLFWPAVGWAHGISPWYFPLGPLPFYLTAESFPFFVLIPFSTAVGALVLWIAVRNVGLLGSLWRAAVLYFVARVAETAVLFLFPGWGSSGSANLGVPALFLCGLAVALPVGLLLYRRTTAKAGKVSLGVCTAAVAGYLATFGGCALFRLMTI